MKVQAPLCSLEASGSVGTCLTFSKRKSGQQVRYQKKQVDVITTKRTIQRAKFSAGLDLWNSLSDNEKSYWKLLVNGNELEL